ncbi:hypothetical protein K9K85_01110 [Patescibacteria group bacterium]|nr:hypothetical protein [Patescibacteria group bacterium]
MSFYHDLITKKSWQLLQELKRKHHFILIGGWAVFLYTQGLKSKDIDFICDYQELEKLKQEHDLIKNQRLKKYEIKTDHSDIDIYLPFFSDLGLPIEKIEKNTILYSGFVLPKIEILMILKQYAFQNRSGSIKGEKDKIDIISLLRQNFNFKFYLNFLKKEKKENFIKELKKILETTKEVPEINLNQHQFSKIKNKILKKL